MYNLNRILILMLCSFVLSKIPVDGVVASVEDKIILKSDVILNMQMSGIDLSQNSIQLENMYNNFLDQMINDYVLIVAAEKDTNILIDNNMVDSRLNEYMNNIIQEVGSEDLLIQMFNKPLREIEYYYQEQIYNAMLRDTYVYTYIDANDISRHEVIKFYESYKDSLPEKPTEYTFSIIEQKVLPGEEEVLRVKNFQNTLLDSLKNGSSFEALAKTHSEDFGTSSDGGNQGYYQKGTLFSEFEDIAFSLQVGEISSPIQTPIGFHIIQLLDKKDNQINTRHILRKLQPTKEDQEIYKQRFDVLYNQTVNDPGMFDSLAVEYSKNFQNWSGVYTSRTIQEITDNYIKKVLTNSDEYTLLGPIFREDNKKYILFYVYNITKPVKPTPQNSWIDIEKYATMKKENDLLMELIEKLKHDTFIKYYN